MKTIDEIKDEVVSKLKRKNFQGEYITKFEQFKAIYGVGDFLINEIAKAYTLEACKVQREICAGIYHGESLTDHDEEIEASIALAPPPEVK